MPSARYTVYLDGVLPQKGPVTKTRFEDSVTLEYEAAAIGNLITVFRFLALKVKTTPWFERAGVYYH
jgi:hypothetical protein